MVSIDDIIASWLFRIIVILSASEKGEALLLISNKLRFEKKTRFDCEENLEFLRILKLEGTEFCRFPEVYSTCYMRQ